MYSNFFKVVLRILFRNRVFSAINILGLAVGIGCGLVIYKIVSYEKSFDTYHQNYSHIYRLINQYNLPKEGLTYFAGQVHPLAGAIRNDFTGVNAAMTFYAESGQVSVETENGTIDQYLEETGLAYAEPQLFEIFDFKFLAGNSSIAISNTGNVVLSSSLAQKYFKLNSKNVGNALGKTIKINNAATFMVTGIFADLPGNTDLPFKLVAGYRDQTASNPYFNNGSDWNEYNSATNCFVLLPQQMAIADFNNQLDLFYKKYNVNESALEQKYIMQSLSEVHSGNCENYNNRQVSNRSLFILGAIGLFLIIIASINFINLSTAQASKRFKEIGVMKISGVNKRQLVFHFMGETILITGIAALIGLFIAYLLFGYLEEIIGYRLYLDLLKNPNSLIFLVSTVLIVGLLSGFYPSLILSRVKPIGILKNSISVNKSDSVSVRKLLVVAQFVISIVLITGTLVMHKQMQFFLNKDLGFSKEAILLAPLPDASTNKLEALKSNLLKNSDVEQVSFATRSPLADWRVGNPINHPKLEKDLYSGNLKTIDENYLDLYDIKLIAGENVPVEKFTGDAVVNRKLTELLGFKDPNNAIGELFTYGRGELEFRITGVVEDFHAESLQQEMDNVIMSNLPFNIQEMAVKINPAVMSLSGYNNTIKKIEEDWNQIFPDDIFDYKFFDQFISGLYIEEQKTFSLIELFAVIAIIIACLGLYGLITFTASQKNKEIGIRKVNGAKISEILAFLNIGFLKSVGIAFLIATPLAYLIMNKWLENFA
ncbi:MAG: ABC transporter permease, partial [Prolixibacteraceae bacterium]|nr:ABC transporter permease [Prolixibacteraceae bacterium]